MNRARSLLNFSSPARALKKFTSPAGTVPQCSIAPGRKRQRYNPPGSSVTLYCTNKSSTEAYVLRYADGPKVHNIAFGPREAYRMTNSCDGLVGVYGRDGFWIANPTIPRVAALPRCSPHVSTFSLSIMPNILRYEMPHAAIGLADPSTGEHKVVRVFVRERAKRYPISLGCEVLSLKKEIPHFWRQIEDPPTYAIAMFSMPLVVDGIVYWTVKMAHGEKGKPAKIRSKFNRSVIALCFNLREEKFSLLHHPKVREKEGILYSNLFLLEGRLCLVDTYDEGRMTVRSLEDRASSEWVRRHDFQERDKIGYYKPSCKRKVYYELPTMDYDDVRTLRHLYSATVDHWLETSILDGTDTNKLKEYRAPYTESNFWPF